MAFLKFSAAVLLGCMGLTAVRIVAVNGREFSGAALRHAIAYAVAIDYPEVERYPHLVRDPSKPDLLAAIIRPHAGNLSGNQ